jgi:uracil-DNA glycosylase
VTEAERRAALEAIAKEVAVCTRCRLHQTRTMAVPGEGTAATEVVFVGEGPGFNEDRQGKPFVGQAGALLTELLASVGWSRGEVFITNVVKCRPPENRDPEPDEIAACAPFLTRQLAALDPAIVVTLGRYSMARFNPGARIGQVHGTFRAADPEVGAPQALTYAMYHPAAALRQGSLKETLFRDMEGVPAALQESRRQRSARSESAGSATAAAVSGSEPGASSTIATPPAGQAGETADTTEQIATSQLGLSSRGSAIGPPAAAASVEPGAESDPTDQLGLF